MGAETSFPLRAEIVTPSDSEEFEASTIYVGTAGNVAVMPAHGETVVVFAAGDGTVIPVRVRAVMSTNTTAGFMVRIW